MMEMMVYVAGGAAVLSIIVCVAKIVTRKRKIDKPYSDLLKKEIEANKIIDGRLDDIKSMQPTTSSFRDKSSSKPKVEYKSK